MILELLAKVLLFSGIEAGVAFTFSAAEGAPNNPVSWSPCLRRDLNDQKDFIVAHRTLPCKSKVYIYNLDNGRGVVATIGDRGPYGKTNGKYRGIIDMAPLVNKALKAKGRANVLLFSGVK